MISKKTITVSIIILLSFLSIVLTAFSCFFLFAPRYIESKLLPSILSEQGIEISSLKVRNIGLNGAEISDIIIGCEDGCPGVDSIRLDYSISGLLGRQVNRIVLSGISAGIKYENNSLSVKGLDNLISKKDSGPAKKNDDPSEPFTVKDLSVKNSIITLQINKKKSIIPFEFYSTAFSQSELPNRFRLKIYPENHEITVEGDFSSSKSILNMSCHSLSLDILKGFIGETIPVNIRGQADIEFSANLIKKPFSITGLKALCSLKETAFAHPAITVKNPVTKEDKEHPIIIGLKSKDLGHWEYNLSPVSLDAEHASVMLESSGTADLSEDTQTGNIKASTRILTGDDSDEIKWNISIRREKNPEKVKIAVNGNQNINSRNSDPITAQYDDIMLTITSPELNINGEYTEGAFAGSYLLRFGNIDSTYDGMSISIPDVSVKGAVQYDMEKGLETNSRINFTKGGLSMAENRLNLKNISANIPFYWPPVENGSKGELSIEKTAYENYSLGPVNINISQKGNNIRFSGKTVFPALPEMTINISGNTKIEPALYSAKLAVNFGLDKPSSRIDLDKLSPLLNDFFYKGKFAGKAEINIAGSDLNSDLTFKVDNSTLENIEQDIRLENIALNLRIEDLVSAKSPFGQRLRIDKLSFGDIKAEEFILDFKVDGPSSLFIEKGQFKWCGGYVNIQSFRVDTQKEEYDLTLFCDRIKLAEILAQFGVADASGGGTVNGKLPVKFIKNNVIFDDGFLYSTPGGGGKIKITGTDILTSGLDPNSAQYVQMDIAREALKAFDYTWVKMTFENEDENLVLKLQFDGKPENRLPFQYSKDIGRFIRVENSATGSEFEGISLDVNFRVPFDRILNIKDVFDMIE